MQQSFLLFSHSTSSPYPIPDSLPVYFLFFTSFYLNPWYTACLMLNHSGTNFPVSRWVHNWDYEKHEYIHRITFHFLVGRGRLGAGERGYGSQGRKTKQMIWCQSYTHCIKGENSEVLKVGSTRLMALMAFFTVVPVGSASAGMLVCGVFIVFSRVSFYVVLSSRNQHVDGFLV